VGYVRYESHTGEKHTRLGSVVAVKNSRRGVPVPDDDLIRAAHLGLHASCESMPQSRANIASRTGPPGRIGVASPQGAACRTAGYMTSTSRSGDLAMNKGDSSAQRSEARTLPLSAEARVWVIQLEPRKRSLLTPLR